MKISDKILFILVHALYMKNCILPITGFFVTPPICGITDTARNGYFLLIYVAGIWHDGICILYFVCFVTGQYITIDS